MGYISEMRKKVGHECIFMPCSTAIIVKDNKILLQRRMDDDTWATHGGSLELGETFVEALNRELNEELSIRPIKPEFIDIYTGKDFYHVYPNKDQIYSVNASYLVLDYDGELRADNVEVKELKWFSFDDLPSNILDVDIKVINDGIKKYLSLKDRL